MSRLVSDNRKKSEENQERDVARLEGQIVKLEASLSQHMQSMDDRLARIEGFLEQKQHSAP